MIDIVIVPLSRDEIRTTLEFVRTVCNNPVTRKNITTDLLNDMQSVVSTLEEAISSPTKLKFR